MKDDKQIIHHLFWLKRFLDRDFDKKEYKELIYQDLSEDITKEVDMLVKHIKENY
jgi:hypothetical protein